MKAYAIKMKDGLFIQNIGAFEDIKKDVIEVDIDISIEESKQLDYKDLRGLSIMERYFEKDSRSIDETGLNETVFLDEKINTIDDLIKAIDNKEI